MTIDEQIAWISGIQWWFRDREDAANLDHVKTSLRDLQKLQVQHALLEKELEQAQKSAEKKFELYQEFIQIYDDFCRAYIGAGAKIDGAQGKAMKSIIAYLVKESKTRNEDGALIAWKFILSHWGRLTKFIQNQTSLVQINKNLQEILTQLRRGKDKQAAQQNTISGTRQRIIERQRNAGTDHRDDQQP